MTVVDRLAQLTAGERPHGDWLLGTCMLAAGGSELVGEEAIVEHFRTDPLPSGDAAVYRSATGLALFAGDAALFADLYGEHVGRLWRIGAVPAVRTRAVAVPFDPDLQQARGDLGFDAALFPDLGTDAARHVAAAALALTRSSPAYRTRCFVLRAFAERDTAVALVARYRLDAPPAAGIGFGYAMLRRRFAGETTLGDHAVTDAAHGDWLPRL